MAYSCVGEPAYGGHRLKRRCNSTMETLSFQMKKPMARTVMPSDSMSIDGGLSVSGMGGYSATLDRPYRQPGAMDYPTATVPRNYHYGPVGGYDDYRGGPPSEAAYTSLSRGSHMDDRYRYCNTQRERCSIHLKLRFLASEFLPCE